MSDPKTPDDRIDALEMRVAYQEDVIDDLNKTITAQWARIDGLSRQLSQFADRLLEAEAKAGSAPASQKPPHF